MCGITAIINKHSGRVDQEVLRGMNDRIIHRGPDGEGYFIHGSFGLGHRRLKITDLTDQAAQPMQINGYVITFNGEIYNFRQLRNFLSTRGFMFTSSGDSEVLLAAYQHWGEACVDHLHGMWSFIIYDPKRNILFCSRDRFGIKPFCYFETRESIFIASEIKQFLEVPGFIPTINNHIAFQFLYHGSINGVEQSFFQDVKFLPAGTNMIVDLESKKYRFEKWYFLEKIKVSNSISYEDACAEFRKLFEASVYYHTRTEVNLGTALSGGLDSSSIACMYKFFSSPGTPLNTISTCFHQEPHNEIPYIDEVTRRLGLEGKKVYPEIGDIFSNDLMEKITYHQDQPIINGSFFSEFKLYEAAGDLGFKVMLSGQGADEYLAGYQFFHYFNVMNRLQHFQFRSVAKESRQFSRINNLPRFHLMKSLGYSLVSGSLARVKRKIIKSGSRHHLFKEEWLDDNYEAQSLNPQLTLTGKCNLRYLSIGALNNFSLPHQLHSEDRHSMMFSVESRLPFLDHSLVEFALKLPDDFKIKGGVTKRILRDSMKGILPEKIIHRHNKLGFPGPEDKLFEREDPRIKKQLDSLSEQFPSIFCNTLSWEYKNAISQNNYIRSLIFRALSFYHWTNTFNIRARKFILLPWIYLTSNIVG